MADPKPRDVVLASVVDEPALAQDIAKKADLPVKDVRDLLAELVEAGKIFKIGNKYSSKAKTPRAAGSGTVGDPARHDEALKNDMAILKAVKTAGKEGITKAELATQNIVEKESLVYMSLWRMSSGQEKKFLDAYVTKVEGSGRSPKWTITPAGEAALKAA